MTVETNSPLSPTILGISEPAPPVLPPHDTPIVDAEHELREAWKLFEWRGMVRYFGKRDGNVTGGVVKSVEALVRAARNLEHSRYNVYLGLNPSLPGPIKAARKHITHMRGILLDLDPIGTPLLHSRVALEHLLSVLPRPQSNFTGIDSGRGVQCWLWLTPTAIRDNAHARELEARTATFLATVNRDWESQGGYRLDSGLSDLPRIVRCPGTINTRTGNRASTLASVVGATTNPEDFLASYPPRQAIEPSDPSDRPADCSNLVGVWTHLNGTAKDFLICGTSEGNRHHDAFAAAKNLQELGVPKELARGWVRRGARRCHPRKLSVSDSDHALNMAYDKEA